MWALIAFIGLGIVVATLIEINERRKAKKGQKEVKECEKASPSCSECDLISVCEKENKHKQ